MGHGQAFGGRDGGSKPALRSAQLTFGLDSSFDGAPFLFWDESVPSVPLLETTFFFFC